MQHRIVRALGRVTVLTVVFLACACLSGCEDDPILEPRAAEEDDDCGSYCATNLAPLVDEEVPNLRVVVNPEEF